MLEIYHNPYLGYIYDMTMDENGIVRYRNNTDCKDGVVLKVSSQKAKEISTLAMKVARFQDSFTGKMMTIDGEHWRVAVREGDNTLETEGFTDADYNVRDDFIKLIKICELYFSQDMGVGYVQNNSL